MASPFLLILTLLTLLTPTYQQQILPLNSAEQESVYLALESVNSQTPWRALFPDDLCSSSPHGVVCGFFPSSTNDAVLIPHIIELSFGYVADSSENPPCSSTSTFPLSVFSLPHLQKLFFYRCFTHTPVSLPGPDSNPDSSELQELVFVENPSLSGSLSGMLRNFTSLRRVIVTGTNVSGGIPVEITKLPLLEQLTLSRNRNLGGEIPFDMGLLNKLKVLDLSGNGLVGNIPNSLGELNLLLKLDLSHNEVVGRIPESLRELRKLEFLDLSYNKFGSFGVPLFLGDMDGLKEVYLSGNRLGGTIPEIWEKLGGILGIGLSRVGLVGNIPPSMGVFLTNLCYLGLDHNKLEGNVPKEFGLLEHVHELNLQHNRLSGRIPFSAPFVGKIGGKLKVEGNQDLCVEKSMKKFVRRGSLGNLRTCDGTHIPNAAHFNRSSASPVSLDWCLVVLLGVFWSFTWLWLLL